MEEKLFFNNSEGLKICGILAELDKLNKHIIIIVHGHASSKDGRTATDFVNSLNKLKLNSFRIDLDGCGESEGKFEDQTITSAVDDIISAIKLVKKRGYSKIDLLGSSFGGLAVMATALKYEGINRIGLKAPVSDYPTQRLKKSGKKYLDDWKKNGYNYYITSKGKKLKINYSLFLDTKKYVMYDLVHDIKCPILIVHGTKDEAVDINDSRKVIKKFKNGKLIELDGLDHSLSVNGDTSLANNLLADWFEKGEVNL